MVIMIQVGGQLADLLRSRQILSTTNTRKVFNCIGFLCQTVFMLATAYTTTPAAAVACLTMAVGFGGLAWSGFSVNHLDIAPQVTYDISEFSRYKNGLPTHIQSLIQDLS